VEPSAAGCRSAEQASVWRWHCTAAVESTSAHNPPAACARPFARKNLGSGAGWYPARDPEGTPVNRGGGPVYKRFGRVTNPPDPEGAPANLPRIAASRKRCWRFSKAVAGAYKCGRRIDNPPVAVGTAVTRCPPHRPVLALLTHTVPTSETDTPKPFRLHVLPRHFSAPVFSGTVSSIGPCWESPWPTAFPPPAPPTVPCPCSPISLVLCGRSTPRCRS